MNKFKAIWLGQPEIRQIVNTLRETNTQIELLSNLLVEGNIHSETLQVCKQQMALAAITVMEAISVGLNQRETPSAKTILVYTYTDIYLAPAKIAVSRCQEIYLAALHLLPSLKEYGLHSTDTEQLNNSITIYQSNLQKEVVTKQDSATYAYTLAKLHHEAEHLLQTRLDILVAPYASIHPEFFVAYQQSRIQEPF